MQGSVSQIFDLGPNFHFMENCIAKKDKKLPVFCHKMKTGPKTKK